MSTPEKKAPRRKVEKKKLSAVEKKKVRGPVGLAKIQAGNLVEARYTGMDPGIVYQMRIKAMERGLRTADYIQKLAKLHWSCLVAARDNEIVSGLLREHGLEEVSIS